MKSTLTEKGQTTIPKEIRDHLGLKAGDQVKYFVQPDGSVVILPVLPITALRGMLARPGQRAVSIEEMDAAVVQGVGRKYPGAVKR
jgi:AbrB family looped-hinge helix DNA binding protein